MLEVEGDLQPGSRGGADQGGSVLTGARFEGGRESGKKTWVARDIL